MAKNEGYVQLTAEGIVEDSCGLVVQENDQFLCVFTEVHRYNPALIKAQRMIVDKFLYKW